MSVTQTINGVRIQNANNVGGFPVINAVVDTTDATQTTLYETSLLDENTYQIEVCVIAIQSGGSNRAGYRTIATFYRTGGGGATEQGAASVLHTEESNAAWSVDFTTNGNNVLVSVTGVAATNIKWQGMIRIFNGSN